GQKARASNPNFRGVSIDLGLLDLRGQSGARRLEPTRVAHELAEERQHDRDLETETTPFLAFERGAARHQSPRQRDSEHAPTPLHEMQLVILDDEREPERDQAETLAQQPLVAASSCVLHARDSMRAELAPPGLDAARAPERDAQGDVRAGRRKT